MLTDIRTSVHYTVGRVEYGKLIKQWLMPFHTVRRLPDGQVEYIVQASIPVDRQTALWSHLRFMPDTRVGLYRDDGSIQARWPEPGITPARIYGGRKLPQSPMEDVVRNKKIRGFYEGFNSTNGDVRLGAYVRLSQLPMTAFVSVPTSLVYRHWWRQNYALVISFIICFIMFFVFAITLLRRERSYSSTLLAQANTDTLTGLPNRAAAEQFLERRIEQARVTLSIFAVIFIDLDRFKFINDRFGHDYGDQVLQQAARRLKAQIREDDLLARLGGDEFIAVLDCKSEGQAQAAANRLLEAIDEPFWVKEQSFKLSVSMGISLYPIHGTVTVDLLKQADMAMYSIKNANRNGYAFFMEHMCKNIEY